MCEDGPCTSVVYRGNWYNEWGGKCLTSPKQCVGEVVKTVGFVATPQTQYHNWLQKNDEDVTPPTTVKIAQFDNDADHRICRDKLDN